MKKQFHTFAFLFNLCYFRKKGLAKNHILCSNSDWILCPSDSESDSLRKCFYFLVNFVNSDTPKQCRLVCKDRTWILLLTYKWIILSRWWPVVYMGCRGGECRKKSFTEIHYTSDIQPIAKKTFTGAFYELKQHEQMCS